MTPEPTKDGGPAFPCGSVDCGDGDTVPYARGLSKREWFAAMADSFDVNHYQEWHWCNALHQPRYTREQARYRFADAMIAEGDAK